MSKVLHMQKVAVSEAIISTTTGLFPVKLSKTQ
ncbi:hypothetical protein T11_11416 [Trichinella zimbabwensis]|uniref:Uncharacterized protein n=1 Tax=Trichinella zimbabwensis TaxID=268475 RepID=A0A0V1GFL8_9BILA|nr:hypothetical protein T11_11416 [Trichinella zimbabwensis]